MADDPTPVDKSWNRKVLLLLAVPPFWMTGTVAANNLSALPHLERLVAIFVGLWLLSALGYSLLSRVSGAPRASAYAIFVLEFFLVGGGAVARRVGTPAAIALALLATGVLFVLTRSREDSIVVSAVMVGLAVSLTVSPSSTLWASIANYGSSDVLESNPEEIELSERPDIWLIVLDGYPGVRSLQTAHDSSVDPSLAVALEEAGFVLPQSVWSSYPTTKMSVPSLLDMAYPVTEWEETDATTTDLYAMVGGDNLLVRTLESNGYETSMVETSWSGSGCGQKYDRCVAAPLDDTAMNLILFRSILGDLSLSQPGVSFAVSSKKTMDWVLENATDTGGPSPRFVFAHVLAPHPPFFLDANCALSLDAEGAGYFYPYPGVEAEVRDQLFARQIECVNTFVRDFVDRVDPSAAVVLVGDHGTGRGAQLVKDGADWTDDDILERMSPFLAIRTVDGCSVGDELVLPNVMRRLIGCLSDDIVDDLRPRMFLSGDYEVDSGRLSGLIGGG